MARQVIVSPNYTQIYNGFLDDMAKEMPEGELRVMLCMFRYTIGYHRTSHHLSVTFIQNYTGMGRPAVIRSLKALQDKGLIEHIGEHGQSYIYKLNIIADDDSSSLKEPSDNSSGSLKKPVESVSGSLKKPKKERSTLKKKDNKETSSLNPIEEQKQEPKKPYVVLNEYAMQTVGLMMNSNDCRLATDDIEAYTLEGMLEAVDIAKAQGKGGINYKYIATIAKNQHAKKMSDLEAKNKQRAKNEAMVLKINPVAPVAPVNDDELDNLFS